MRDHIIALWRGEVPLSEVFWTFTITVGTLINLLATGMMLAALAAGMPAAAAVLIHFLPLPYNVLALTAVWRSAQAYQGPKMWSHAAKLATAFWFAAMVLI
jgi:hypothetical protein